ncbi:VWA3B [Symbiodinium natans]|uniref:VWA3B protein n=1 Tax=Symbiodinium natans TaxID=878477 RepID=A0A812UMT6_9DINO|nr:VWA3B [Symbiodinium natans]
MHEMPADPGHTYIVVSLRPRERAGSVVSPLPVHYSVARVDIIEFERLAGRKVQECRMRLDFFKRCLEALNSLLDRGASREEYVPNMLPYSYRQDEEFGSLLEEVDEGTFGQVEGFRPVIVLDTSGLLGQNLVFVKAAIKRLMYSFIVAKSRFNLITFNSVGKAVTWEDRLVPPVAQKLREAESFVDLAQPCSETDLLEAMRWAVQSCEADMVYLITSGFCKKTDVEYCRADIRSRNLRQLPIHVIGVQCEARAEVDLRRLAEENRGSFRHKSFRCKTSVSGCFEQLLSSRRCPSAQKRSSALRKAAQRLSVGGQIDILEVLVKEQEIQTTDWLEEQKCSNRILLTTSSQHPVPDVQQARYAAGRLVVNQLCRCAPPPLRELLQERRPRRGFRPCSARETSTERWVDDVDDGARRPSVQNPWDRPSGVVKVSQVASCEKGIHPARAALYRKTGSGYEFAR